MLDAGDEILWTVVVAGGVGRRFGSMKQYELLPDGRRVLDWSVQTAESVSNGVVIVLPAGDIAGDTTPGTARRVVVAGGASRSESCRHGIAAVPSEATVIAVHDAARPFASPELYRRGLLAVVGGAQGAVPALAVTDTIKLVDEAGFVVATPARDRLAAVQTPQVFRADVLRRAYESPLDGTDDASLVEAIGGTVLVIEGEPDNRKITQPDDLRWACAVVSSGTAGVA